MQSKMGPFESRDVAEVVGIRTLYLNKFVERRLYGIEPSARSAEGRGSRRWFTLDDVHGIALVWWLFEAGLRTDVIKRVLRDLGKSKKPEANLAARLLLESRTEYLMITREPRLARGKNEKTPQKIARIADYPEVLEQLEGSDKESLHILPVGRLLADLDLQVQMYGQP